MKNKRLYLCVGLLIVAGCVQAQNNFIVMRDVPQTPSFTIIPFNFYHSQIDFANQVEEALITLGVKTVERPSTKSVTTKRALGTQKSDVDVDQKIDAMLFSGKSAQAISIEEYIAYDEIKSDYIISSDVLSNRIKIISLETNMARLNNLWVKLARMSDHKLEKLFANAIVSGMFCFVIGVTPVRAA